MSGSEFEYYRLAKERQAGMIRQAQADRFALATKRAQGRPSALKSLLLLLVSHN